jgi:hypothetical protein
MPRTIWKFPLNTINTDVEMPKGARVLSVQAQDNEIFLWAEVTPTEKDVTRYFDVFPTGAPLPERPGQIYLGTVLLHGGKLVFHVYENLHGRPQT